MVFSENLNAKKMEVQLLRSNKLDRLGPKLRLPQAIESVRLLTASM